MNINFEYHDVTASSALEEFAKEQIEKLVHKYDFIIRADIFFKMENTSSDETGKIAGIRLSAPGPRLFAEHSSKDFYESVKTAVRELDSQLKKRKEKMKSHH
ncbi:MAG: ribosomal subunit interface protein [Leeuwenhoekiella sp.]|nr:MAG: ribosomal subunit interface protein [Leeuwenhoekiella sp.]